MATAESAEIRQLEMADLPRLAALLARNFTRHSQADWAGYLESMASMPAIGGQLRLGLGLFGEDLHGAVLTISSPRWEGDARRIVTNISSWCVDAGHRGPNAKRLYEMACAAEGVTYSNLSAAAHTIRTIEGFGFRRWSSGQLFGLAVKGSQGRMLDWKKNQSADVSPSQKEILSFHARHGCIVGVLATKEGPEPLIFLPRRVKPGVPCVQLIYCRDLQTLRKSGQVITAFLAKQGRPFMIMDSNGPMEGFLGRYFQGKSMKYYKGRPLSADIDHRFSELIHIRQ